MPVIIDYDSVAFVLLDSLLKLNQQEDESPFYDFLLGKGTLRDHDRIYPRCATRHQSKGTSFIATE